MENNPWVCPKCGRKFTNTNQDHSCVSVTAEDHFKDKPQELKEAFYYLVKKVGEFGPIRIDAVYSGINLAAKSHFAMIHPQKNSLNLEFFAKNPIQSNRIFKKQMMGPGNYIYYVKLLNKQDVDSELVSWLREAYFFKS